jgi:hypothetical protein
MHNTLTIVSIREFHEQAARLDSTALHQSCGDWQRKERRCQLHLLIFLAEVAQRKLFLDLGYSHLGDYCQHYLGLSEGESWTRAQIAKASIQFPELLLSFANGQLSLTVAGMIARYLTPENKGELLSSCAGKSKREVEIILARFTGEVSPQQRSSLRPMVVPVATTNAQNAPSFASQTPQHNAGEFPVQHTEPTNNPPDSSAFTLQGEPSPRCVSEQLQLVHQLRCTISDATKTSLLRLAEVLGIVDPLSHLELLIAKAAEIALQVKDPALQQERRKKAEKSSPLAVNLVPSEEPELSAATAAVKATSTPAIGAKKRSRYIARSIRRSLLQRAGHRCEFTAADGTRCTQKTALQIDHRISFCMGGSNNEGNLMILCGQHNRRKFEREMNGS